MIKILLGLALAAGVLREPADGALLDSCPAAPAAFTVPMCPLATLDGITIQPRDGWDQDQERTAETRDHHPLAAPQVVVSGEIRGTADLGVTWTVHEGGAELAPGASGTFKTRLEPGDAPDHGRFITWWTPPPSDGPMAPRTLILRGTSTADPSATLDAPVKLWRMRTCAERRKERRQRQIERKEAPAAGVYRFPDEDRREPSR